jgi:serine/threonine protein kinase
MTNETIPDDILAALGDRYVDIEYIASGASGVVFKALDRNLDKRVAIKVLKSASERDLVGFQKEARAAAKLEHINLVSTLNFGITSANSAYIILEFVDGLSLEKFIESSGSIPLPLAINLLLQIANGLAHAHSKNIAHRDLKTSNVMVYGFGTSSLKAVIIDFGLAGDQKLQEESQLLTGIFGSPLFISPEQAQGKKGDFRSDIYSLGCIAYHLIAGTPPFQSNDLFTLLRQHVEDEHPPLSALVADVEIPADLQDCLDRMLDKDPDHRFQKVEDVAVIFSAIEQRMKRTAEDAVLRSRVDVDSTKQTLDDKSAVARLKSKNWRLATCAVGALVVFSATLSWLVYHEAANSHKRPKEVQQAPSLNYLDMKGKLNTRSFNQIWHIERANILEDHECKQISPKARLSLTDENLALLKEEPHLKSTYINLSDSPIKGAGLQFLNRPEIEVLDLSDTNLDAVGYEQLAKLKYVQKLNLSRTAVGEKECEFIAKMPRLKELHLVSCENLNDKCLYALKQNSKFEHLNLAHTHISDDGMNALSALENLRRVELTGNSSITDDGGLKLLQCKKLTDFKANACPKLTGKTLKAMAGTYKEQLSSLALGWTAVKAEDVSHLSQCPKMCFLDLSGIPITDRELNVIGRFKELDKLFLSDGKFSEEALKNLIVLPLKSLEGLAVVNCGVSKEMLKELQAARPNCVIVTGSGAEGLPDYAKATMDMILDSD